MGSSSWSSGWEMRSWTQCRVEQSQFSQVKFNHSWETCADVGELAQLLRNLHINVLVPEASLMCHVKVKAVLPPLGALGG